MSSVVHKRSEYEHNIQRRERATSLLIAISAGFQHIQSSGGIVVPPRARTTSIGRSGTGLYEHKIGLIPS